MAVIITKRLKTCHGINNEILIDVLIFINKNIVMFYISLCTLQSCKSAVQVWGIPSYPGGQQPEVEDEDKEAFKAYAEALFADVL